jgi:hypothetical protein
MGNVTPSSVLDTSLPAIPPGLNVTGHDYAHSQVSESRKRKRTNDVDSLLEVVQMVESHCVLCFCMAEAGSKSHTLERCMHQSNRCVHCLGAGHTVRACPNKRDLPRSSAICYKCYFPTSIDGVVFHNGDFRTCNAGGPTRKDKVKPGPMAVLSAIIKSLLLTQC